MKVLMDTSVLISAMLPDHAHHGQSRLWLERVKSGVLEAIVSGHSLAELYSVLTRLPRTPRISPSEALKLIQENVLSHADVVTLSGDDYVKLIEELSRAGVVGGAVYDALIAKVAQMAHVDNLVTLNIGHFQQVWPSGASRVVSALATTPP